MVTNDLCAAFPWDTVSSWKWKKEKHINILETEASNALAKRVARRGGDMRYVNLLDSHVARSAVTKARTFVRPQRSTLTESCDLSSLWAIPCSPLLANQIQSGRPPHQR